MENLRAEAGARVNQAFAPTLADARAAAVAALGRARFDDEFSAGQRPSRDVAAELALGQSTQSATATSDGGGAEPFGKREADVARLVAGGLSNKEIGARLFISERTVESHVRNILNKLGFNTRAQIAAWMASSVQ